MYVHACECIHVCMHTCVVYVLYRGGGVDCWAQVGVRWIYHNNGARWFITMMVDVRSIYHNEGWREMDLSQWRLAWDGFITIMVGLRWIYHNDGWCAIDLSQWRLVCDPFITMEVGVQFITMLACNWFYHNNGLRSIYHSDGWRAIDLSQSWLHLQRFADAN